MERFVEEGEIQLYQELCTGFLTGILRHTCQFKTGYFLTESIKMGMCLIVMVGLQSRMEQDITDNGFACIASPTHGMVVEGKYRLYLGVEAEDGSGVS